MLTAVACLTAVVPAVAQPAPPSVSSAPGVEDLQHLRDQLAAANGDLEALDVALRSARSDLDEIEQRLDTAQADLTVVENELTEAEQAFADASREASVATDQLLDANAQLDHARSQLAQQESVVAGRVRSMWKYGGSRHDDAGGTGPQPSTTHR